jgi:cephalosporin hydroxylase
VQPTWIIETGTKFGGSAIFFASMLQLMGKTDGGVLTVDIELKAEAKEIFATHPLGKFIRTAIEADASSDTVIDQFRQQILGAPGPVIVFLDDNHNAEHVLKELELYSSLVTTDSYIVVEDTSFQDLAGTPAGNPSEKYPNVAESNPRVAVNTFLSRHKDFVRDFCFSGTGFGNYPDGFLKRVESSQIT